MGLDLYCGNESQRVGSYSGVHVERAKWILAEAKRRTSIGNTAQAKRLKKLVMKTTRGVVIDYDAFQRMDWLPGIRAFVDHSDCDGYWTPQEAEDMLDAIAILKPFFDPSLEGQEYYLESIWKRSVDIQECISFN